MNVWKIFTEELNEAQNIIDRFNKEILNMIIDGSYNRILQLNWIRVDVDGDGRLEMVLGGSQAGKAAPKSSYDVFFQNSNQSATNSRYFINGKIYQDWDKVPKEYKVAPMKAEDMSKIGALNFSISKPR